MKPTDDSTKVETLDTQAGVARRAQKFLKAMMEGGTEAFEKAWVEDFHPEPTIECN